MAALGRLVYYAKPGEDPYLTLPDQTDEDDEEDLRILPSENLVVVGHTEEELSTLEVYCKPATSIQWAESQNKRLCLLSLIVHGSSPTS